MREAVGFGDDWLIQGVAMTAFTELRSLLLLVSSLALIGCGAESLTSEQRRAAVEGQVRSMVSSYVDAINQSDRARFLDLVSDDMLFVTPTQQMIRGREAVAAATGPLFEQFLMNESIQLDELHVDGDWAAGRVSYVLETMPKAGGSPSTERGSATVSMRRNSADLWQWSQWIADPMEAHQGKAGQK